MMYIKAKGSINNNNNNNNNNSSIYLNSSSILFNVLTRVFYQVNCLEDTCGMLDFHRQENPDQVYRLWMAIFAHAG